MKKIETPDPSADRHYTLVLLKNGNYLELKNPDSATKAVFPTLDAWIAARVGDVNTTNAVMFYTAAKCDNVANDKHGFNVPTRPTNISRWFLWCYYIIKEGAPELFENKAVANAYNDLLASCSKYPELIAYQRFVTLEGESKIAYAQSSLRDCSSQTDGDIFNNFPLYFNHKSLCSSKLICASDYLVCSYFANDPCMNSPSKRKIVDKYMKARKEIWPKCKALYDLIVPKIVPFMAKMNEIEINKRRINQATRFLKKAEEKRKELLREHENKIKYYEDQLKSSQETCRRLTDAPPMPGSNSSATISATANTISVTANTIPTNTIYATANTIPTNTIYATTSSPATISVTANTISHCT